VTRVATTEMEAAVVRPGEMVGHRFTVGRRGYEPEEVDRFLEGVADQLARLQGEIEWQRARIEHLEQRGTAAQDSAYDRIAREFMEVVRRADEATTQVRAKAEDEAGAALPDARVEANRILETTAREAERLLQAARTDTEGLVAERQPGRWSGSSARCGPTPPSLRLPRTRRSQCRPRSPRRSAARPDQGGGPIPRPQAHPSSTRSSRPRTVITPPLRSLRIPSEPAFADFEALTLEFEGSAFDLFGDAGS
jgi:DivIVA domain-containing protein